MNRFLLLACCALMVIYLRAMEEMPIQELEELIVERDETDILIDQLVEEIYNQHQMPDHSVSQEEDVTQS